MSERKKGVKARNQILSDDGIVEEIEVNDESAYIRTEVDPNRKYSEFYFECKVLPILTEIKEAKEPEIHLEKNFMSQKLDYRAFLVIPDWLEPKEDRKKLLFDKVSVYYDTFGINPETLDERARRILNNDYKNEVVSGSIEDIESINEIDISDYRASSYAYEIVSNEGDSLSGVGLIKLESTKTGKKNLYYIAINCKKRKPIFYSLRRRGNKLLFYFEADNIDMDINVNLVSSKNGLPIVKGNQNIHRGKNGDTITIRFKNGKSPLYARALRKGEERKAYYGFEFEPVKDSPIKFQYEDFFMLVCRRNDTIRLNDVAHDRVEVPIVCPYCHQKINLDSSFMSNYKNGGVACNGKTLTDAEGNKVYIYDTAKNEIKKNIVYCKDDLLEAGKELSFEPRFQRVLPYDYLNCTNYKIGIVGSPRCGKTVLISRMFNIQGSGQNIEMGGTDCVPINTLKSLATISSKTIPSVEFESKDDGKTNNNYVGSEVWHRKENPSEFYGRFAIGIAENRSFPRATESKDSSALKHPFIFSVERQKQKSNLFFYDIAGEDVKNGRIDTIMTGNGAGLFLLIDADTSVTENNAVFERINSARLSKKLPVAVILSKFDMLEKYFSSSAQVLRTDTDRMTKDVYEGSELEAYINICSKEIESFLKAKDILPHLDFENVKYFAVSSFQTPGAILRVKQSNSKDEVNNLNFMCSPKHVELPIAWMLKQLGIII